MYTSEEQAFLRWMEDHHASDQPAAFLKDLTPGQRKLACQLVRHDVLEMASSRQRGPEETVVWARSPWVFYQWARTQPLPKGFEEVQVHHQGFGEETWFIICRTPGPLHSVAIVQLLPEPGAQPPYRAVPVPTAAATVVEAMEQVHGQPFEARYRQQLLKTHQY